MAEPMSAGTFLNVLRAEGVDAREYKDWRNHNRNHKGAWGPINGVMIHHSVTGDSMSAIDLLYDGYSSLPGPLCHTGLRKDGTAYMVGNGRANHAGSGDDDVLRAVIAETSLPPDNETNTDGNARFYGIEILNRGDGKDAYPAEQYDAAVRWAAAICRHYGWTSASVIGHLEWQPGKIDPRGPVEGRGNFDMDQFRRDVSERLSHAAGWNEEGDEMDAEQTFDAVWNRDAVPSPETVSTHETNPTWKASSYLKETLERVDRMQDEVASIKSQLAILVDALLKDPSQ